MSSFRIAITAFLHSIVIREEGQDLVEYALIMAMITLGSVTGMGSLASGINDVFCSVATTLTSHV